MTAVKSQTMRSKFNSHSRHRDATVAVASNTTNAYTADMAMTSKMKNDTPDFTTNTETHDAENTDLDQTKPKVYPKGWRLHALTAG
jgi:hypothetical protein